MDAKQERFLTVPVVLGICLAAVAGTATVFYQTNVVNPTVEEYFSYFTLSRLLILTHVHAFGYATMGYVLWALGRRRGLAEGGFFGTLLGLTVAIGIVDVLSWWGVVYLSPLVRFVTFAAGAGFVGGILLSALLVLRATLLPASRSTRSKN
ncbi:MAG: hypothetical protein GF346_03680 [Candidatus Eisenbacteria bacterium]|nr:hypothetical protein [Candidatus Latescibacterota bacterium]MBD3301524.1 hypothetical protein [Candidatus Eisenbacteria bacterium]